MDEGPGFAVAANVAAGRHQEYLDVELFDTALGLC